MKLSTKISMMALMAMFAFSTPAEAQFGLGKLARKARKAVGLQTQQDKYEDMRDQQRKEAKEHKRKQDSIQAVINSITPTIPQPAAEGTALVNISWGSTKIGTWDPVKQEIEFNQTYDDGEYAGKKVKYILNPQTGQWKSLKGTDVGRMSNDGTIESPNLGTIKLNTQNNKVVRNGEIIGEATMLKATSYGTTIGSFDAHVSPLLMAFTFHGSLISEKQVADWKVAKQKRDAAEAERIRAARAASASSSSSSSSSSSGGNTELRRGGSQFGELRSNGDVYIGGSCKGQLRSNGDIYVGGSCKGEIRSNGDIYKSGRKVGEVRSNGDIYEDGRCVGEIRSNGEVRKGGSQIGEARNMHDARKVAVIYFFGFF